MKHRGIDVSQWQGNIDFYKVKKTGHSTVYIKSSEGNDFVDPYFEQNYKKAVRADMSIGFYHYVTARSESQARHQAHFFISVISNKKHQLRPAMDYEDLAGLSTIEINNIAAAFLDTLEKLAKARPMIYSDVSNGELLGDSFIKYPLWTAQYGVRQPEQLGDWKDYAGWQYNDNGKINGIVTPVDLDIFKEESFFTKSKTVKKPSYDFPNQKISIRYIVKKGDTLTKIARLYHTTVSDLVKENQIKNPNLIIIGQELKIIIDDKASSKKIYYYYKIVPNDTLSAIAEKYHTTVEELLKLNDIKNPNLIYPGQILKILK